MVFSECTETITTSLLQLETILPEKCHYFKNKQLKLNAFSGKDPAKRLFKEAVWKVSSKKKFITPHSGPFCSKLNALSYDIYLVLLCWLSFFF